MKRSIKKISSWKWDGLEKEDPWDQELTVRYFNNQNTLITRTFKAYKVEELDHDYLKLIEQGYNEGDFDKIDFLVEILMCFHSLFIFNHQGKYLNKEYVDLYADLVKLAKKHDIDIG